MTSKSTITKRTISRKKQWLKQLNNPSKNKQNVRESIGFFVMDDLEGICERCGNEVIKNLYEN